MESSYSHKVIRNSETLVSNTDLGRLTFHNLKGTRYIENWHYIVFDHDFKNPDLRLGSLSTDSRIKKWFRKIFLPRAACFFPGYKWDIYRSKNGVRIIQASNQKFNWCDEVCQQNYNDLAICTQADSLYIKLNLYSGSFRIRVSPKEMSILEFALTKVLGCVVYKPVSLDTVAEVNPLAAYIRNEANGSKWKLLL